MVLFPYKNRIISSTGRVEPCIEIQDSAEMAVARPSCGIDTDKNVLTTFLK